MLVLSRKVHDSILFPELDISIEIVQVKGKSVRVGIDAPVEIKVLRGELESTDRMAQTISLSGEDEHEVRNKLNSLSIGVALAKKLIERGDFNSAAERLHAVLKDIQDRDAADSIEQESNYSALVVEDQANEREMLAGFLRLHGYKVDTVPDGLAAMDYLESNPKPDLVMLDIGMPRMNGAELIKRIRENPSFDEIRLYAISGDSPQKAKINITKNRIAKWFQKPLQPAELVSEINREFQHHDPACN